jgi:hypothetical protein
MSPASDSTFGELLEEQRDVEAELRRLHRRRWARRLVLALLALIVVAAVVGVFGERSRTVEASGGGDTLRVRYPWIVRDGPPTSLDISIRRASGFAGPVEVAINAAYLSALEQPDVSPRPDTERSVGDEVVWTFARPEGYQLTVQIAAHISSQARFGRDGHLAVRAQGRTLVRVEFTTWVWP